MSEYHRLDFNKLSFSNDVISYEEALENATPLKITNDIISGQKSNSNKSREGLW